ncbi:MAG: hypothetical protein RL761_1468 [Pseudomonadota bacterium]
MKLVLASNNRGKLAELQALFAGLEVTLIPQASLGVSEAESRFAPLWKTPWLKPATPAR